MKIKPSLAKGMLKNMLLRFSAEPTPFDLLADAPPPHCLFAAQPCPTAP